MNLKKKVVLVGYSGHAYVAAEAILLSGFELTGYVEKCEAIFNPYQLSYLGFERDMEVMKKLNDFLFFPSIGSNCLRGRVYSFLKQNGFSLFTAIHPNANVSKLSKIGEGSLVCQGVNINPLALIGKAVIVNTGAIVEHECVIGNFTHIAPGTVLAGNVTVGENSFIGANAVIKQGVRIGKNVVVGAGAVVLHDIPDNQTYVGNPAKILLK